jgi:hypothetical protein
MQDEKQIREKTTDNRISRKIKKIRRNNENTRKGIRKAMTYQIWGQKKAGDQEIRREVK